MPCRARTLSALAAAAALAACSGCANTYIQPDTDPSLRGPRFYIPRPYIVVLKPYPVAENSWVLPGKVAPDGVIVAIDQINQTPLAGLVFTDAGAQGAAPFLKFPTATRRDGAGGSSIGATSGDGNGGIGLGLTDEQRTSLLDELVGAGSEVDAEDAPTGGDASAWVKKGDITELRDPVNDLFEIRYLPDMSQRYVLVGEAGLGTAKIDAYLTRGWLAHHYGKEIDRSELGRMVFGNVQAVLDIARAAGKTALIASTGGLGAIPVAASEITATSGAEAPAGGQPRSALLRFTVIEYAVPGVYPILREDEMRERVDQQSGKTYYELEITGSFQQPASAALPVGYRTTKVLIVSTLRDGEDPTAEYRASSVSPAPLTDDLEEAARLKFESYISEQGIPTSQLEFSAEANPDASDEIRLLVTITRTPEFPRDEDRWRQVQRELGTLLGTKSRDFPHADKIQTTFAERE